MLLDLVKEKSSENRRHLLFELTDVFLANTVSPTEREAALFDEVVEAIASDLETRVRVELSRKIAVTDAPVRKTAYRLAMDVIEVARPVLERSRALDQRDILDVIEQKGEEHLLAVARRPDISEAITSALVSRGRDRVVFAMLENDSARLDRSTYERVANRAEVNPVLHAPFVKNRNVPLDLLNFIFLQVSTSLRYEILRRFHAVSAEELDAALQISMTELSIAYDALPTDYPAEAEAITRIEANGALRPSVLIDLLREGRRTAFLIAFSRLVGIEFSLATRLVKAQNIDALAMLCRCAGFDRALFVTLCLTIGGTDYGMSRAEAFGQLYEQVPVTAAQRVIRFWKARASREARH
jgi:uncharacterized protein (DUF2336 family)